MNNFIHFSPQCFHFISSSVFFEPIHYQIFNFLRLIFLPHFCLIPSSISKLFINFAKCKPE